jgi:hypothetical protein
MFSGKIIVLDDKIISLLVCDNVVIVDEKHKIIKIIEMKTVIKVELKK